MTQNSLVIIILAYSRIDNVKNSIKCFAKTNLINTKLVVLLDRNKNSALSEELFALCSNYKNSKIELKILGGFGHDLAYKEALLNYNNFFWKWIVNDSIILDSNNIAYLHNSLKNKKRFDCIFLSNLKTPLINPLWYATRTGWTILQTKFIDVDFISINMFNNFPQLMVFKDVKLNFCELRISLNVNKNTSSYWRDNFWSTWYVDFVNALYKLGYNEKKIREISIFHAEKNHFFSIISLYKWPKSFYSEFNISFSRYLSKKQLFYFKLFKMIHKIFK